MQITSILRNHFDNGLVLDVMADDLSLRAYVAVSPPDLEAVTGFVPQEQFEGGSELHVAAIATPEEVEAILEDVFFNMNADDAVALLCADAECWNATLEALGHVAGTSPLK